MTPQRVISSVGRALRLHRRCREFESLITHHQPSEKTLIFGAIRGFCDLFPGSLNLAGWAEPDKVPNVGRVGQMLGRESAMGQLGER